MEIPSAPTPTSIPPAQPPAKSNTTKIILIVVAVLAVLCLISCGVGLLLFRNLGQAVSNSVESDPQDVSTTVEGIASFTPPAGFTPQTSMSILGMSFVIYEGSDSRSAMVLIQMPTSMEMTEANIKQMQDQMERQSGRRLENFETIKDDEATIRGKPGRVIIQEGESDGQKFRQMLVVFQGKGGLAMLSVFGPADQWNQAAYDKMIQSMK